MKYWLVVLYLIPGLSLSAQPDLLITYMGSIPAFDRQVAGKIRNNSCDRFQLQSISVNLKLSKNGRQLDSTIQAITDSSRWYQWKDSIAFTVSLPAALARQYDAFQLTPWYNFLCTDDQRGEEELTLPGPTRPVGGILLKMISDPPNAETYLIPKYLYEKKGLPIDRFRIARSNTPVWVYAYEYVYIALFRINDKQRQVECQPKLSQPIDSVQVHF